jgi:2-polyprenyl-3-methyl-5-hydroxy-6-metoxy-1,4-benzoquinol methylase
MIQTPPTPGAGCGEVLPTRAGYDRWAPLYDTDDNPLLALEEPAVDHLLGSVRGLTVLDAGCGTGRHALRMAAGGAAVHAVDFSLAMLREARRKPGASGIAFAVHDLAEPLPFAEGFFDRVVCGLVLDHIGDLERLFRDLRRVCRPSAHVVVSVMHPAMMLRGVQARFRDPQTGREIRPLSYPHQLSDYIMAASQAGMEIDHLSEHACDEALARRMRRARPYVDWPMLFLMRLRPGATLHPHEPATISNGHVEAANTFEPFQGKFGPESGGTATAAGSVLQIGTTDMVAITIEVGKAKQDEQENDVISVLATKPADEGSRLT